MDRFTFINSIFDIKNADSQFENAMVNPLWTEGQKGEGKHKRKQKLKLKPKLKLKEKEGKEKERRKEDPPEDKDKLFKNAVINPIWNKNENQKGKGKQMKKRSEDLPDDELRNESQSSGHLEPAQTGGRTVSWAAVWHDASDSYYYANEDTGETSWEQPTDGLVVVESEEHGTLYLNHETGKWE